MYIWKIIQILQEYEFIDFLGGVKTNRSRYLWMLLKLYFSDLVETSDILQSRRDNP